MKTFTIDAENNIATHASGKAARETGAAVFATEEQFSDLIGPGTKRLIEIWNSLPGVKAVTKFTSRKTATERIWKAIQSLGQTERAAAAADEPETAQTEASLPATTEPATATSVAPHAPDVAPEKAPAKTKATKHIDLLVARRDATTAQKAAPPGTPREGSKTSQVIAMLKREGGTTLEEIMTAMGWQRHTTRAMLSAGGSLTKKHGLVVTSEKVGDKRTYSIKG